LRQAWKEAGRDGDPEIVVLSGKPDPGALERWAAVGVTEALFGLPDADEPAVVAYLGRLAGKLGRRVTPRGAPSGR